MNSVDNAILSQLGQNSKISMIELGEQVGLSSSATHRRVKALEAAGVIRGYRADIDPSAIGRNFEVIVSVFLAKTDPFTVAGFESAIASVDNVMSCHRLFGEPDYSILVAVADVHEYETLWSTRLSTLPGTARVASQMTMKTIKTLTRR